MYVNINAIFFKYLFVTKRFSQAGQENINTECIMLYVDILLNEMQSYK